MKFIKGAPPQTEIRLTKPALVKLPSMEKLSAVAFGVGLVMVAAAVGIVYLLGAFQVFQKGMTTAMDAQGPLVFVAAMFSLIVVHELIHAVSFPGGVFGKNCVFGMLPREGMAYAFCGAPMSRNRFIVAALAPTVVLTLVPVALFPFFPDTIFHLLPMAALNLLSAGGDILMVAVVLKTLPRNAWVQESGVEMFHGGAPTAV